MFEFHKIKEFFPISNDRIITRLFIENDIIEKYINWLNDPTVVEFSNQRFKKHSLASCKEYYNSFIGTNNIFIAILDNATANMIGTMTVYINSQHMVADMGIMLGDKNYWGLGLGKEAWQSVMNLLLEKGNIRKVTGGTLACNNRMIKIFKSTGMQEDGVRTEQELVNGQPIDILHFAKFCICKH